MTVKELRAHLSNCQDDEEVTAIWDTIVDWKIHRIVHLPTVPGRVFLDVDSSPHDDEDIEHFTRFLVTDLKT